MTERSDTPAPADAEREASCAESGSPERAAGRSADSAAMDEAEALREQLAELNDRYLRALAEHQNFQRRAHTSISQARQEGATRVLRAILPVLDQFDLASAQAVTPENAEQIARGVGMIRDQLLVAVQSSGVELISPRVGEPFDAARHQAVVQQPGEGVPPGHVSIVMRAGYSIGGVVVRPAQVAVAPTLA